jgi:transcriptional regulator with XRE-family HTH domain
LITEVIYNSKQKGGDGMKIVLKDQKFLKELLVRNGYSQRSFSRAIEISEPYGNQICNGTRNPGPNIAKKIVDQLGVAFDEIFFVDVAYKNGQSA